MESIITETYEEDFRLLCESLPKACLGRGADFFYKLFASYYC